MTRLLDLAPEILNHIVRSVSDSLNPRFHDGELYQIALTCRTLFQIIEPLLYTKFVQTNQKSVRLFLRTILEKPQIAARVKFLKLAEVGEEDDYYDDQEEEGDDYDEYGEDYENYEDYKAVRSALDVAMQRELVLLNSAYERLRVSQDFPEELYLHTTWPPALIERNHDALSAILLFSLPSVKCFSLHAKHLSAASRFFYDVTRTARHGSRLAHLEEINYLHGDPQSSADLGEIQHYFYIPSLRKVKVHSLVMEFFIWGDEPPCMIEDLSLTDGAVANSVWHDLFTALGRLKSFSYQPGMSEFTDHMVNDALALGGSLPVLRNTLESLDIRDHLLDSLADDLLGYLQRMSKLKTLTIQVALLIGGEYNQTAADLWELLPASLESIRLWGRQRGSSLDRIDLGPQILGLVTRKDTLFLALNKLDLFGISISQELNLRDSCEVQGIQLYHIS